MPTRGGRRQLTWSQAIEIATAPARRRATRRSPPKTSTAILGPHRPILIVFSRDLGVGGELACSRTCSAVRHSQVLGVAHRASPARRRATRTGTILGVHLEVLRVVQPNPLG